MNVWSWRVCFEKGQGRRNRDIECTYVHTNDKQKDPPGVSILAYRSRANFIWRVQPIRPCARGGFQRHREYDYARPSVTENNIGPRALRNLISLTIFGKRMPTARATRPTTVNPMTGIYSELQAVIKRTSNSFARGSPRLGSVQRGAAQRSATRVRSLLFTLAKKRAISRAYRNNGIVPRRDKLLGSRVARNAQTA